MSRPAPVPDELTAEFWKAAGEGRLVIPGCSACGHRFFVPEIVCPACRAAGWRYRPSDGVGTVYSFSVVHRPPGPGFDVPYVLAAIELAEGVTLLSNLVGCDPAEVCIGMPVRVSFEAVGETLLPMFRPEEGAI